MFFEILIPIGEAEAGFGGDREKFGRGIDGLDVGDRCLLIKPHRLGNIKLGQQHHIGGFEEGGVFQGFIFAFGGGEQHDAQGFPQVIGRRTDQIAHIFHDQQLDRVEVEVLSRRQHHVRFQVAEGSGGDLDTGNPGGAEPLGIVVGFQISHNYAAAQAALARGGLEEGGFAGTGGGNHVQYQQIFSEEIAAIAFGEAIVFGEDGFSEVKGAGGGGVGVVMVVGVVGMIVAGVMVMIVIGGENRHAVFAMAAAGSAHG